MTWSGLARCFTRILVVQRGITSATRYSRSVPSFDRAAHADLVQKQRLAMGPCRPNATGPRATLRAAASGSQTAVIDAKASEAPERRTSAGAQQFPAEDLRLRWQL